MSARKVIPIVLTLLIFGVVLPRLFKTALLPELPSFGGLPSYSFTNQNNQTLNNESFLGKVQLINFFFTSCHGPCPRLMADISKVEREVDNAALQILSISVDPSRDTPEVLQQYKEKFPAKVATWHLATTDKASLLRFAEDGLKLALGEEIDLHSTRVVLVDQKGNMRGLFDPKEDADALVLAIRSLL